MSAMDRDALAREMIEEVTGPYTDEAWEEAKSEAAGFGVTYGLSFAKVAMRHIEAAVTAERERLYLLVARTWPEADDLLDAIRAGSPAPAAPVVWTDAQLMAWINAWFNRKSSDPVGSLKFGNRMRAALEAASRENKP